MPIQVLRKGRRGRDKQDWIGIPGSQATVTSASVIGTVITSLADGASGGAWTYTLADPSPYFAVSGSDLVTTALVPVGTWYARVKLAYGGETVFRTYKVTVLS